MKLEIQTLAFIQCLVIFGQVIVLFVQYRVNRVYLGVGWWVVGSLSMALGVIFMPMVYIRSLVILAMIANPLVVLGQMLLYKGVVLFLCKKENKWILISIFLIFIFSYYYYMFFNNSITGRTVVVYVTTSFISIMTAYKLFLKKSRVISSSVNFTAVIFFIYGCFLVIRVLFAILLPPMHTYSDQGIIFVVSFITPTITSMLWTFGFIIMINQRLNIENLIEKEKLQNIFNTIPDAAMITRMEDGFFIDVNHKFLIITGYTRDEIIGQSTIKINLWHNLEERKMFITQLYDKGSCEDLESVFERKDGSEFVGMISARIIPIYEVPHIICAIHDITDRKIAEAALIDSEARYRSILNASPDDITLTDLEGRIIMLSPASKDMFGYEQNFEGFIGMNIIDFIIPEEIEKAKLNLELMYKEGNRKKTEYHGVRKDKSIFNIEVNSGFIRNSNEQPTNMIFIIRDNTEKKLAEEKIQQLIEQLEEERNTAQLNSITDSLTGIANRRYFDEALKTEFYRLKRSGTVLSLIMLDVDYFKKYNDNYGHLAGDDCLRQIGKIISTIVGRVPDIVARYGGEEFVVILPETDEQGAKIMAERIRKEIEKLEIPHSVSDISEFVTVSVGVVTVYTAILTSPEQVVELADEALYCAKKNGRNRIETQNYSIGNEF